MRTHTGLTGCWIYSSKSDSIALPMVPELLLPDPSCPTKSTFSQFFHTFYSPFYRTPSTPPLESSQVTKQTPCIPHLLPPQALTWSSFLLLLLPLSPPSAATRHSSLHHVLFPLTSSSPSPLPQVSSPLLFRLFSFQFLARKVCCTPSPNSNLSPPSSYYIEFSSVAFLFSSLNLAWISPPWQRRDMLKLFSHPALEQSYQQKLLVHGDRGPTFAAFSEDKWGSSRTSAILHLTTTNPKTHLSFACR